MIFDKDAKTTERGKNSLFKKQCWENWIPTCKRMRAGSDLIPYTKINSKRIKDLNLKPQTIKL